MHHINKRMPKEAHPRDAFGGANGSWLGTARFAHILGPAEAGEEESRFLGVVKANHGRDDVPAVEFFIDEAEIDLPNGEMITTGKLNFVSDQAPVNAFSIVHYKGDRGFKDQQRGGGEKLEAAIEFVTLMLMKGPRPVKWLTDKAAKHGVSKMTLRRAAEDMGIIKQRVGFGKRLPCRVEPSARASLLRRRRPERRDGRPGRAAPPATRRG